VIESRPGQRRSYGTLWQLHGNGHRRPDTGWGKPRPADGIQTGPIWLSFEIKEVDKKAHLLKVELVQVPAVQGRDDDPECKKTGEIITMIGGYDFSDEQNSIMPFQAYRQDGLRFQAFSFIRQRSIEWGHDARPRTVSWRGPSNINGWQAAQL